MLDLTKYIYPKHIYEKEGKELLSALRKGALFLLIEFLFFYLVLPYFMYMQIGIAKYGSKDS